MSKDSSVGVRMKRGIKGVFHMSGQWRVWGGMAVRAGVHSYSPATWHPFYRPAHRQMQHTDPEERGEERRGRTVGVGSEDKRRESGGETAQQCVYAGRTTAGKLTPGSKMLPKL